MNTSRSKLRHAREITPCSLTQCMFKVTLTSQPKLIKTFVTPMRKNAYCHTKHASLWHEANSCKHVAHIFEQIHVNMLLISSQVLHSRWIATADMTLEGYKSFLEFVWWLFLANLLHVTLLLYWDFVFFVGSCSLNLGFWFVLFFHNGILNLPELNIYY